MRRSSLVSCGLFVTFAALFSACGSESGGSGEDAGLEPGQEAGAVPIADGSSPGNEASTEAGSSDAGEVGPLYDGVQVKSSHNSYERDEPLFDQLAYHRLRGLELDIHNGKRFQSDPTNDFYVYHVDAPGFDSTSCRKLSDCVKALAAFHAAQPEHEVVTVFVDVKDDFENGHRPDDLDAVLSGVGRANVFAPKDLLARCPGATTLLDATRGSCTHPSLAELRGKFVFALTGGNSCSPTQKLEVYVQGGAAARLGFVAPEITQECPLSEYGDKKKHVVFLNFESAMYTTAGDAAKQRYLTRVYNLNDEASFTKAKTVGAHFLGTNKVNVEVDPWASTAEKNGYPFRCLAGCPGLREKTDLFGIEAKSGDLAGTSDSFVFAYETVSAQAVTWTTALSVASSHVERGAKACLMARASNQPNAAFFAVCRPSDNDTVRVLRRDATAAAVTTVTQTYPTDGKYSDESTFFARLTVTPGTPGPRVKGEGSIDGVTWVVLDERTFPAPLPLEGVAVASKADTAVHALFAGLTRSAASKTAGRLALTTVDKIGGASGTLFDRGLP
jgi:hypothetical protein